MNFMAKLVLVALFIFAANTANAVGILVPKDQTPEERQAYINWKMAGLVAAGVIVGSTILASELEDEGGSAPSGTTTGGVTTGESAPTGMTTGGQPPSGVTLAPGETVSQVGGVTTYRYIPQW